MKFSAVQFEFGKCRINLNSIDTDAGFINVNMEYPINDTLTVKVNIKRQLNWYKILSTECDVQMLDTSAESQNKKR